MTIQTAFDFSTSGDDYGYLYLCLDMDSRGYIKPGETQNIQDRRRKHRRTGYLMELAVYVPGVHGLETKLHTALGAVPGALIAGREYYSLRNAENPALVRKIIVDTFRPYCRVDPERQALDRIEAILATIIEEINYERWLKEGQPYKDGYEDPNDDDVTP